LGRSKWREGGAGVTARSGGLAKGEEAATKFPKICFNPRTSSKKESGGSQQMSDKLNPFWFTATPKRQKRGGKGREMHTRRKSQQQEQKHALFSALLSGTIIRSITGKSSERSVAMGGQAKK